LADRANSLSPFGRFLRDSIDFEEITQLASRNSRPTSKGSNALIHSTTNKRIHSMISIQNLRNLIRDDRGLSTVEYVILLVLIAAVAMGTWQTFGAEVQGKLDNASNAFTETVNFE
jgi:Flp pilus assembly pilin Flp